MRGGVSSLCWSGGWHEGGGKGGGWIQGEGSPRSRPCPLGSTDYIKDFKATMLMRSILALS